MAITDPFKDFSIYPNRRFRTPTADPALSSLETLSKTVSSQPTATAAVNPKAPKLNTTATATGVPAGQTTFPQRSAGTGSGRTAGPGPNPNTPTVPEAGQQPPPTGDKFTADSYYADYLTNNPFTVKNSLGYSIPDPQGQQKVQSIIDWDNAFIANAPAGLTDTNRSQWEQGLQQEMQFFAQELSQYPDQYDKIFKNHQTRMGWLRQEFITQHGADETYGENIDWLVNNFQSRWNNESVVSPFESEWKNIFGDALGDLTDFGSSTDFLSSFINNFGLNDIVTGKVNWGDYGFENYSPEALKKFIESGAGIPGFEYDASDPNVTNEQEFIKFLMGEATKIRDRIQAADFDKLSPILSQAQSKRLQAATQLLNQPGLSKDEFDSLLNRNMANIRRDAESQKREIDLSTGLQLAGASTKSIALKRLVDRDLQMAEAQVRGDLTEMDVNLRKENYQKGIEELGSLSRDEITKLTQALGIEGQREGQVLNFMAEVGRIALGSKDTEYKHYESKLKMAQDFYLQNANRMLEEKLGQANLDLQKFDITTDAGLEQMRLAYQTALQNRGMDLEEAVANSNQMLETYKIGQSFAQMDINRLATIADLAAKAQEGDREAWGLYQGMILEEQLKNRGMDIEQAQSLSQLVFGMWQTDKQSALTMWVEKYRGELEKELAQMEIDAQPSPWLQAVGNLFGGVGAILPFLKGTGNNGGGGTVTPPGDYNPQEGVYA